MLLVVKRGIPVNRWALVSPLRSVSGRSPLTACWDSNYGISPKNRPLDLVRCKPRMLIHKSCDFEFDCQPDYIGEQ